MKHAVVTDLVRSVSVSTAAGDHTALVRACSAWPAERLVALLSAPTIDVVSAAVIALGVKGSTEVVPDLVGLLAQPDPRFVEKVEDSLFAIWMRAGTPNANHLLADAVRCIREENYREADEILAELVRAEPGFAEPHHQRGIALAMLEEYPAAEREFVSALEWNIWHYSAAANLGHARVQLDDFHGALEAYQTALRIHPTLAGMSETLAAVRALLQQQVT
ncbi:MAG: tetratricopeptide repeat protein [Phycisphaerae bacterium]|nr:tetratricopeptide repeat protein [Phycisphaerae bacterium]